MQLPINNGVFQKQIQQCPEKMTWTESQLLLTDSFIIWNGRATEHRQRNCQESQMCNSFSIKILIFRLL